VDVPGGDNELKYFTREWWANATDHAATVAVVEKYDAYYASIRAKLPSDVVLLNAEYTLHDAKVISIDSNFTENTVEMLLNGWDRNLQVRTRYKLRFSGLVSFDQQLSAAEHGRRMRAEPWLGDLEYWEYELLNDGVEMRMLFDSGAEFHITFKDFTFEHARA
jgi:hypothetical protein